jgi:hypothetical protein
MQHANKTFFSLNNLVISDTLLRDRHDYVVFLSSSKRGAPGRGTVERRPGSQAS